MNKELNKQLQEWFDKNYKDINKRNFWNKDSTAKILITNLRKWKRWKEKKRTNDGNIQENLKKKKEKFISIPEPEDHFDYPF